MMATTTNSSIRVKPCLGGWAGSLIGRTCAAGRRPSTPRTCVEGAGSQVIEKLSSRGRSTPVACRASSPARNRTAALPSWPGSMSCLRSARAADCRSRLDRCTARSAHHRARVLAPFSAPALADPLDPHTGSNTGVRVSQSPRVSIVPGWSAACTLEAPSAGWGGFDWPYETDCRLAAGLAGGADGAA